MYIKSYLSLVLITLFSCKTNGDNAMAHASSAFKSELIKNADGILEFKQIMGNEPTDIKITFTDVSMTDKVRVVGFYSDQNFLADTLMSQGGVIHYKNPKGLAQGMYYFSIPGKPNDYIQLFVTEDQQFEVTAKSTEIMASIQIKGSEDNTLFYENMKFETGINAKLSTLNNQLKETNENTEDYKKIKAERDQTEKMRLDKINEIYNKYPNSLFANFKYGGQNPKINESLPKELQVPQFRREFWNNVNFSDPRLLRTPMIGNKMKRYFKELTPQNADSILSSAKLLMNKILDKPEYFKVMSNWVVLTYEPTKCDLMDAEAVFSTMVKNYFTKERAFWQDTLTTDVIQKRAYEMGNSLIGQKAPNVISTDPSGAKQELLAKTAPYIVVYMFNPECEHCQEETPKLYKYWQQNKDLVDVYAIAIETDDTKWRNYIAKNNLQWTNVYDPTNRSIYAKYYVDITPEMYVINKERKIIGKNLKSFQVQTVIDKDKATQK